MTYDETLDAVWAATTPARRRAALDATLRDMAADCLFYGRKDDEVLPVGAIERMLVTGEVSLDFILATVGGAFHAALADDAVAEPDADEPDEPRHQGYEQARALKNIPRAAVTRAAVEAALERAGHERVLREFGRLKAMAADGGSLTTGDGRKPLVDLVCAVLGVGDGE